MNTRRDAVAEQVRLAMQASNAYDIVAGVKGAVADEVRGLSPDAEIVVTDYFNHSYMPDLVLRWNDGRGGDERPIFLRTSLRPSETARDVTALASRQPVMVSLAPPEPEQPLAQLREQMRRTNRFLLTDINSLVEVASPAPMPQGLGSAPLLRLVQANLLRGGRGLLTSDDAERLTRQANPAVDSDFDTDFLTSFEQSTDELFAPDAALRLRRAAEILQFGLNQDDLESPVLPSGQLSDGELRIILPHLLSNASARRKPQLWAHLGSMMSAQQLEDMWDVIGDQDVSVLIVPNLSIWTARRAQLVLDNTFTPPLGDHTGHAEAAETAWASGPIKENGLGALGWQIQNRIIVGNSGPIRLLITTDARRLKGRKDGPAANWDDISGKLDDFTIDSVDLLGAARRISVSAERSSDVTRDVAAIRANIKDSFYVREMHIRNKQDHDSVPIKLDFTGMTLTADWAPIAAIVRAANILGYRESAEFQQLMGAAEGARRIEPTEGTETSTGGRVFIAYRRSDSSVFAGRLRDAIAARLGDHVFLDIASIEPGADFMQSILRAVDESYAMLVLISPGWLEGRRLDEPDDYLRQEIKYALERRLPVIPVLVGGASMPRAADLPDSVSGLARLNAVQLSNATFDVDVRRITSALDQARAS